MEIYGIGNDLVDIIRIKNILEQYSDRFIQKVLTQHEITIFYNIKQATPALTLQKRAAFVAKRFAAKEAFVKALGTGFSQGIHPFHIGIKNNQSGKPEIDYQGIAEVLCNTIGITHAYVSLSDEKHYALATVILCI